METRLCGAEGDAECGGNLGQRHAGVDMQDDQRPALGFQPPEGGIERLTLGDLVREVIRVAEILDGERDLDRTTPLPAGEPEAGANRQAMDPGLETIRIAETGQVPPRSDHRLLDGIPGQLRIPEDEPGGPAESPDQRAGERGKGVMIAPLRALHE
jgi:hypothetical protein